MVLALLLASCSGARLGSGGDPLTDLRDPLASEQKRLDALELAWADPDPTDHSGAVAASAAVAWSPKTPLSVRLAAVRKLLADPEGVEALRARSAGELPTEPELEIVRLIGRAAAERGWTEFTPVLVRSYARTSGTPDDQRPEHAAILALHPGQTVESVAFSLFALPDAPSAAAEPEQAFQTPVQRAAWDVLGRLDPDGRARAALLEGVSESQAAGRPILADLQRCHRDLRTIPITGEELIWLASLANVRDAVNVRWWTEAAEAIAKLTPEQAAGLRLRHAEPIRWAANERTAWLAADRASLLADLASRLQGRRIHRREVESTTGGRPPTERLAEVQERLVFGDIIAILAIDDAVQSDQWNGAVFGQAAQDADDRTTEYGGLLYLDPGGFRANPYPPPPSERFSDQQFVASPDMISQGDLAAAHYHFHVAEPRNAAFSGPSEGDLAYATRFGRSCLVITSIGFGVLSVDYYQPGGITLDLGELRDRP
jgi:hypothetical protein